jgi:hypothetical protein
MNSSERHEYIKASREIARQSLLVQLKDVVADNDSFWDYVDDAMKYHAYGKIRHIHQLYTEYRDEDPELFPEKFEEMNVLISDCNHCNGTNYTTFEQVFTHHLFIIEKELLAQVLEQLKEAFGV